MSATAHTELLDNRDLGKPCPQFCTVPCTCAFCCRVFSTGCLSASGTCTSAYNAYLQSAQCHMATSTSTASGLERPSATCAYNAYSCLAPHCAAWPAPVWVEPPWVSPHQLRWMGTASAALARLPSYFGLPRCPNLWVLASQAVDPLVGAHQAQHVFCFWYTSLPSFMTHSCVVST